MCIVILPPKPSPVGGEDTSKCTSHECGNKMWSMSTLLTACFSHLSRVIGSIYLVASHRPATGDTIIKLQTKSKNFFNFFFFLQWCMCIMISKTVITVTYIRELMCDVVFQNLLATAGPKM